jgi:hypothetical protein
MAALPITSRDPPPRRIAHLVLPVSVVALRAEACDGTSVIISLATKYSGAERVYSVPLECFHDLIVDLRRLNALSDIASN